MLVTSLINNLTTENISNYLPDILFRSIYLITSNTEYYKKRTNLDLTSRLIQFGQIVFKETVKVMKELNYSLPSKDKEIIIERLYAIEIPNVKEALLKAVEASSPLITANREPNTDIYGGIDLNQIKISLKEYAGISEEEKKQAIGKFKTLLCIDALLDKKWFSLAHLYFQEIIHLVKDKLVSELDRDKLLIAASALKVKGYLIDRQGLEFLKLLEAGKTIGEIRFLLSP